MLYDYLITAYKVVAGLVTPERLIGVALCAFGLFIFWICIALFSSFQRKFNSRCQNLINLIIKTKDIEKTPELIDQKTEKISSGFGFGWKKFKESPTGKPSDYITRRESLDVEINGGVLNQGKSMMRAYIAFVTVVLFIFNFVYVGGENAITFVTFAESLILPFVFYVLMKLFYFLHSSIRQKLYKLDIESFYELVDLLDLKFVKKSKVVYATETEDETTDENTEEKFEEGELSAEENVEEQSEPENALDKYDVFKKKNLDVSKLMNETPQSDSSLPFINVDSDYVIKDEDQVGAKKVSQDDNASTILGGMMQNTSSKKDTFVDVEKSIAKIDEEKLDQISKTEIAEQVKTDEISVEEKKDIEINFNEEIDKKKEINLEDSLTTNIEAIENVSDNSKFIEIEENIKKERATEKSEEEVQEEKDNIASVVSDFKANRSKLSNGGIVIERNQPISKRERTTYVEPEETIQNFSETAEDEITRPIATENTDMILNSLKTNSGNYDAYTGGQTFAPSTNYGNVGYNQTYGYNNSQMYQTPMNNQMQGYGYAPSAQPYQNYNQNGYTQPYQNVQQTQEFEQFDNVEEQIGDVQQTPKKKIVRTKENEPRPRNLKSSSKVVESEEEDDMAKRGRPKKPEYDESMVIENDEQFNEVLARAEKLMRKSDEGLSESQSKRIEKEIKILMDAMNRYKESK